MTEFNPNDIGVANGNFFGLPFTPDESRLVLLSVPWDVTTSYGGGASGAPDAMIDASLQCDLYDRHYPAGWKKGIGTLPIDDVMLSESRRLREEAERVIWHLGNGGSTDDDYVVRKTRKINESCTRMVQRTYEQSCQWLDRGKIVGVIGGDHSTPLGLIRAVSERHEGVGILHIDAHADLREAYEGFEFSHASIMYNTLTRCPGVTKLVQVGIRDTCDDEIEFARNHPKVVQFDDYELNENRFNGLLWKEQCHRIIDQLPQQVYVSFDIDGLSPDNCPHTGTPVPGGLSFHEAVYLIAEVVHSGRRIVGFDLNEVSPDEDSEWDANVGARLLYKLCNLTLLSDD